MVDKSLILIKKGGIPGVKSDENKGIILKRDAKGKVGLYEVSTRKIILMLDTSSSMSSNWPKGRTSKIKGAKESIIEFMAEFLDQPYVSIGLVTFGGGVNATRLARTIGEKERLKNIVNEKRADGQTPMMSAFNHAIDEYNLRESKKGENVTLVLATDGQPTDGSKNRILSIGSDLKKRGVEIITIGIGDPSTGDLDEEFLERLASSKKDSFEATTLREFRTALHDVSKKVLQLTPGRQIKQ